MSTIYNQKDNYRLQGYSGIVTIGKQQFIIVQACTEVGASDIIGFAKFHENQLTDWIPKS